MPRTSFAAWKELVRGTSAPWTIAELDIDEDIARRAVESDLEQQIDRAEKAVRARDDLLAIVSHDLKNPPLNVIEMASAQARKQVEGDAQLATFDRIDHKADAFGSRAHRTQERRSRSPCGSPPSNQRPPPIIPGPAHRRHPPRALTYER